MKQQKTLYDNIQNSIKSGIWTDEKHRKEYKDFFENKENKEAGNMLDTLFVKKICSDMDTFLEKYRGEEKYSYFVEKIHTRKNLCNNFADRNIYLSQNQRMRFLFYVFGFASKLETIQDGTNVLRPSDQMNHLLIENGNYKLYARDLLEASLIYAYNSEMTMEEWLDLYQSVVPDRKEEILSQTLSKENFTLGELKKVIADCIAWNCADYSEPDTLHLTKRMDEELKGLKRDVTSVDEKDSRFRDWVKRNKSKMKGDRRKSRAIISRYYIKCYIEKELENIQKAVDGLDVFLNAGRTAEERKELENYLSQKIEEPLMDMFYGGSYIEYTDDEGTTRKAGVSQFIKNKRNPFDRAIVYCRNEWSDLDCFMESRLSPVSKKLRGDLKKLYGDLFFRETDYTDLTAVFFGKKSLARDQMILLLILFECKYDIFSIGSGGRKRKKELLPYIDDLLITSGVRAINHSGYYMDELYCDMCREISNYFFEPHAQDEGDTGWKVPPERIKKILKTKYEELEKSLNWQREDISFRTFAALKAYERSVDILYKS